MDLKFFKETPTLALSFLEKLKKNNKFEYMPSLKGVTKNGQLMNLGFSCYALKINFMSGAWNDFDSEYQKEWSNYIKSYQSISKKFPLNYFIDDKLILGYKSLSTKEDLKYILKSVLNLFPGKNYDSKKSAISKAINAETKQAIATLYEVGFVNELKIENKFSNPHDVSKYLSSLNWDKPWSSGAQFASLCVYSKTNEFGIEEELNDFIMKKLVKNTGSYHNKNVNSKREIINGAMKVISGLDWLNQEIHQPRELIDFCLTNVPETEGCDIVDFVYVLYKCSKQINYRKKEINQLFLVLLDQINKLYITEDEGFSYFQNMSQTHYYGVQITKGLNKADLHGTTLCLWAILMILDNLEEMDSKSNIIKP